MLVAWAVGGPGSTPLAWPCAGLQAASLRGSPRRGPCYSGRSARAAKGHAAKPGRLPCSCLKRCADCGRCRNLQSAICNQSNLQSAILCNQTLTSTEQYNQTLTSNEKGPPEHCEYCGNMASSNEKSQLERTDSIGSSGSVCDRIPLQPDSWECELPTTFMLLQHAQRKGPANCINCNRRVERCVLPAIRSLPNCLSQYVTTVHYLCRHGDTCVSCTIQNNGNPYLRPNLHWDALSHYLNWQPLAQDEGQPPGDHFIPHMGAGKSPLKPFVQFIITKNSSLLLSLSLAILRGSCTVYDRSWFTYLV